MFNDGYFNLHVLNYDKRIRSAAEILLRWLFAMSAGDTADYLLAVVARLQNTVHNCFWDHKNQGLKSIPYKLQTLLNLKIIPLISKTLNTLTGMFTTYRQLPGGGKSYNRCCLMYEAKRITHKE